MPRMPASPCTTPRCRNLSNTAKCGTCTRRQRQAYEATRQNSHQRGYTREWSNYSKQYLADHPWCKDCGQPSEHTDHIVAVSGGDDPLFWEPTNHQPLCRRCHSSKTARQDGRFTGRKRVRPSAY